MPSSDDNATSRSSSLTDGVRTSRSSSQDKKYLQFVATTALSTDTERNSRSRTKKQRNLSQQRPDDHSILPEGTSPSHNEKKPIYPRALETLTKVDPDYTREISDGSPVLRQAEGQKSIKWRQEHIDMLLKLKADGTSWTEIAKLLDNGKTAAACRNMYSKAMKGKEVWTPALDQELKTLYRARREIIWTPIASKLGLDWRDVEARVATLSLNTIKNG